MLEAARIFANRELQELFRRGDKPNGVAICRSTLDTALSPTLSRSPILLLLTAINMMFGWPPCSRKSVPWRKISTGGHTDNRLSYKPISFRKKENKNTLKCYRHSTFPSRGEIHNRNYMTYHLNSKICRSLSHLRLTQSSNIHVAQTANF
jgi:hypothetical protein